MSILIAGGGRLGSFLAAMMETKGRKVSIIEKDEVNIDKLRKDVSKASIISGDACDLAILKKAGIHEAEIVVAATGHDEDNLIICQLAKFEYGVAKVIARVNNPKNEWFFTKDMGVDAVVSSARMTAALIEEEAHISNIITILNLVPGEVSVVKSEVSEKAKAANKALKDLSLPEECVIAAIIRDGKVVIPRGSAVVQPGDELLSIVSDKCKNELESIVGKK